MKQVSCQQRLSRDLALLSTICLILVYQMCMTTPTQLAALKRDIQANYLADGPQTIAARHNLPVSTVHSHASKLGVTSNKRWDQEKEEIVGRYKAGEPIKAIARDLGHYHGSVKKRLIDWGVTIRTPTESKAQYAYDTTFFKTIDTHEKAYWLGFIYADGNVYLSEEGYKHVFQIGLAAADNGHLDKLKSALRDERPLYPDKGGERYMINSIPFAQDLMALGVMPRKSLDICFPTSDQVPAQFVNSFMLGYFDGDGSLSVKPTTWYFDMVGTWPFLTGCQDHLVSAGLVKTKLVAEKRNADGKLAYLVYGGSSYLGARKGCEHRRKHSLIKLYRYLYADSPVWLDRKRALFEQALTNTYGHDWC